MPLFRTATRRTVLAALLCLLLPAVAVHGGAQEVDRTRRFAEYRTLIERYEAGDTDGAAAAVAEKDERWLTLVVTEAQRDLRGWTPRRAQAAVLLHTDAAVDGWARPSRLDLHLVAAQRLARVAGDRLVPPPFLRDWLLVVSWYLQARLDLAAMPQWLDLAVSRFGTDSDVQMTLGSFFEALAWTQNPPSPFPWDAAVLRPINHRSPREALEHAALAYRRVVTTTPDSDQGRIRLGRTLVQLRRPAEALTVLAPVLEGAGDRRWPYLAWLVTAAAELDLAHLDAAASAYQRASALLPACQTALVGLSAVRRLQGLALEGARIAEQLATPSPACDDPWWFYRFGQPPDRRARLLLALRQRVVAP